MTPAALFDRMAATYDAQWTATPVGRAQRDAVWHAIDPLFHPGDHVLDIGCGTGEDAAHLMAHGITVHATDASPAMVAVAQSRGVRAEVRSAEDLHSLTAFDGVLSNFGALNCVADLPAVAASLARITRPGAPLAICLLSRVCLWETLYYALRLQFRKSVRRLSGRALASTLPVYYPTAAQTRAAFAPHFALRRWTGIGLLVPPSYVKLPAPLVRALAACDHLLAHLPLLRAMADHRLFLLVKK